MNAIRRKRIRTVRTFTLWGAAVGFVLGLIVSRIDQNAALLIGARGLTIGLLIGAAVGIGEEFLLHLGSRRLGFFTLNALRLGLYGTVMMAALILVNGAGYALEDETTLSAGMSAYVFDDRPARDFVMSLVAVVILTSFLEIRTLHNRGEMLRFLTGRYRYPEEEVRVFLFADIVGSTALAERLGNLEYSSLLRECFADTSEAVLAWGGDVYQFAGDGVILTWRLDAGLRKAACVRCFFEMARVLDASAPRYQQRYGAVPRLRGAIHGGEVVTTWVGEAKKELAFHGDTLNVAARIEAMCKDAGAECLASEWVLDRLELPSGLESRSIGEVELRGSEHSLALYALSELPAHTSATSAAGRGDSSAS